MKHLIFSAFKTGVFGFDGSNREIVGRSITSTYTVYAPPQHGNRFNCAIYNLYTSEPLFILVIYGIACDVIVISTMSSFVTYELTVKKTRFDNTDGLCYVFGLGSSIVPEMHDIRRVSEQTVIF